MIMMTIMTHPVWFAIQKNRSCLYYVGWLLWQRSLVHKILKICVTKKDVIVHSYVDSELFESSSLSSSITVFLRHKSLLSVAATWLQHNVQFSTLCQSVKGSFSFARLMGTNAMQCRSHHHPGSYHKEDQARRCSEWSGRWQRQTDELWYTHCRAEGSGPWRVAACHKYRYAPAEERYTTWCDM